MDNGNIIIVSADGHASAPVDVYAKYLEPPFHHLLWQLAREIEESVQMFGGFLRPTDEEIEVYDTRGALAAGAEFGSWNAERRIRELDAEGIAAELLLHSTPFSLPPFFSVANRPWPAEVRAAGARAWNRFIADMIAVAPSRLLGVVEAGPCYDMAATVAELEWCAERGFVAVTVPGSPADPSLPPLHTTHFEPFWSACEELGLVLSVHAGWGAPQGSFHSVVDESVLAGADASQADVQKKLFTLDLGPRSVLWKLMLGGVFDRHPALILAFTEIRADWLPATLSHLDERLTPSNSPITMSPTDYCRRNCVVVPSSIHRVEVQMRHEIGIDSMLFGADHIHFEGTWPNTWDWIRDAFVGVDESEARSILGENAIRTFRLDRRTLTAVAKRIGPAPEHVLVNSSDVSPRLIELFDKRAAYLRPADVLDTPELDALLTRDLADILATSNV